MMSPALLEYLKQCKSQYRKWDDIVTEMRGHGWPDEQIAQAQAWYVGQTSPALTTPAVPQPVAPATIPAAAITTTRSPKEKMIAMLQMLAQKSRSLGQHLRTKKAISIFAIVFTVLVVLTFTTLTLIAYEKISIGSPEFRAKLSDRIIGLPFMPKTPKFLLRQTIATHKTVTHAMVDFSLSATSNSFTELLGGKQMDISVKGPYDYTNLKSPKFAINLGITKDLNADVTLLNKKVYLRVNKVPPLVLAAMQGSAEIITNALGKWYYYDASALETDAQKNLEEYKTKPTAAEQSKSERLETLMNTDILPEVVLTQEALGEFSTYKMHLTVTKPMIDALEREMNRDEKGKISSTSTVKVSDTIQDFRIDQWIDKQKYYTRKLMVQMKMKNTNSPTTLSYSLPIPTASDSEPIALVSVLLLSDFEKAPNIVAPESATKLEDYIKAASMSQQTDAYYTKLKSDMKALATAISKYKDDRGVYPINIGILSPKYITASELDTYAAEQISYLISKKRQVAVIYASNTSTPIDSSAKYFVIYIGGKGIMTQTELTKEEFAIEQKSF